MDNYDKEFTKDIQNIHDKMLHAFQMHLKIAIERRNIIAAIDKLKFIGLKDPKAEKAKMDELMAELATCNRNERRIIAITAPGIAETKIELNKVTRGKEKYLDKEDNEILTSMYNVLDYIEKNINLTFDRIVAEEKYIHSQDDNTNGKYAQAVRLETESEEKILKLLNPAYIETLSEFKNKEGYKRAGVAGAVVSVFTGYLIIVEIAAMLEQYKKETENILKEQKAALLKFDHRDRK